MVEFTSTKAAPRKGYLVPAVAGTVLILLLAGIVVLMQYQKSVLPEDGESAAAVPDMLRPGNTDFEYYKTKVRIEDVKAVIQISFNQVRTAKISGTIVNDGDRMLDAVELHFVLYDVWGEISKERTAFVLRPKSGFSGKPVEPLGKRRFEIGVESVELYWNPEEVSYDITGLRYQ